MDMDVLTATEWDTFKGWHPEAIVNLRRLEYLTEGEFWQLWKPEAERIAKAAKHTLVMWADGLAALDNLEMA
jgi:hypothetical protein